MLTVENISNCCGRHRKAVVSIKANKGETLSPEITSRLIKELCCPKCSTAIYSPIRIKEMQDAYLDFEHGKVVFKLFPYKMTGEEV